MVFAGAASRAAAFALSAVLAWPAAAADITVMPSRGGVVVSMSGKIEHGDTDRLEALLDGLAGASVTVHALALNSPGGYLIESLAMADVVRARRMTTFAWDTCASACFVVYAAGSRKLATPMARLGVHTAYEPGGATSSKATATMAEACRRFGVPQSVLAKMAKTRAPDIAWITRREARAMGVRQIRAHPSGEG
jgi:hypothetical protein